MDPNVLAAIARGVPFNALQEFQSGLDNGRKRAEFLRQRDAQIRAGNALGAGQYGDAANALTQGGDAKAAIDLLQSSDPNLQTAGGYGMEPFYYLDPKTKELRAAQLKRGGGYQDLGVTPAPPTRTVNTGMEAQQPSSRPGGPSGPTIPLQPAATAQARAEGTGAGETTAAARAVLPDQTLAFETTEKLVNQALTHPGLPYAVGLDPMARAAGYIPEGIGGHMQARADFDALTEQLKGQGFINAYIGLKGGGQISNIEGDKATQAQLRLNSSQSVAQTKAALQEMKDLMHGKLEITISKARGPGMQQNPVAGAGNQRPPEIDEQTWGHMTPDEQRAYLEAPE